MLSILIPVYNYDITALVLEVQKQCSKTGTMYEIIIANDNPHTPLKAIYTSDTTLPHCRFIQNPQNLGRTLTRKNLALSAQYNTLLFLDADVIPVNSDFISLYLQHAGKQNQVVVGGYAYKPQKPVKGNNLRYKYGIEREQKTAEERSVSPYENIFSGNFMIDKEVFLTNNYNGTDNFYGMDIYFSYQLYVYKANVIHIDNPIYHLGLENDAVFFAKCVESVKSRHLLLANAPGIENLNSLLRYYKTLKKYSLAGIVGFSFKIGKPLLKTMILKKDPNLFCLDLYRLGYMCTL